MLVGRDLHRMFGITVFLVRDNYVFALEISKHFRDIPISGPAVSQGAIKAALGITLGKFPVDPHSLHCQFNSTYVQIISMIVRLALGVLLDCFMQPFSAIGGESSFFLAFQ